jgi:hypothetical protein
MISPESSKRFIDHLDPQKNLPWISAIPPDGMIEQTRSDTPSNVWLGHRTTILVPSCAGIRLDMQSPLNDERRLCTMMDSIQIHEMPGPY